MTTLAVFLPTPGSETISAIVRGTSPACFSSRPRAKPTMLFAFAL